MTPAKQQPNQPSLSVPGDTVNQATSDLPDKQRSAIRWLHSHALDQGWTIDEAAKAIRREANTLYQVWTGRHQAGKASIAAEIDKLRQTVAARAGTDALSYIETRLSKQIWQVCENALVYQRIAFIFGDSQIGKTTALEQYQQTHNHGETIMITMPAGGLVADFLREMADKLRISSRLTTSDLKRRIIRAFDSRMLLIIDEAHQAMRTSKRNGRDYNTVIYEFLRELHDRTKCGLVISATNVFRDEIDTGRQSGVLSQLSRRRLCALQLPNHPTKADLETFAAAYALPPAEGEALEVQTHVIRDQALGVWLMLLRMTAGRCHRKDLPMDWDQVIRSHDSLRKLETLQS